MDKLKVIFPWVWLLLHNGLSQQLVFGGLNS
jgi:hypothetical protein